MKVNQFACIATIILIPFLTGCAHRVHVVQGAYRFETNGGYPLLVPALPSTRVEGDFQTSTLKLTDKIQAKSSECTIPGDSFALHTGSQGVVVRSWSLAGWNHRGADQDVNEQWRAFLQQLDQLQRKDCFADGIFSMQQSIARIIAVPADDPGAFLYSEDAAGFADLAPSMEIQIEEISMPTPGVTIDRNTPPMPSFLEHFRIDPGPHGTVRLRRWKGGDTPFDRNPGRESDLYPGLSDKFQAFPLARLFFQQFASTGATRPAMLLGAANLADLEAGTKEINDRGTAACSAATAGVACVVFKDDSVSLFSALEVNGKLQYYPLGTRLASILGRLPEEEQTRALASIKVLRLYHGQDYAAVEFPRTMQAAGGISLLPGDRLSWR